MIGGMAPDKCHLYKCNGESTLSYIQRESHDTGTSERKLTEKLKHINYGERKLTEKIKHINCDR